MANYKFMKSNRRYYRLAVVAMILGLFVVMLGAYTRLSDAGLGCPDWPGCYGKLVLPDTHHGLTQAQKAFPAEPIIATKAWTEMVHRYFAGTLGLLILILAVWAPFRKRKIVQQPVLVPWLLVGVVIFQAMLGMWTVTLKLLPLVVMGHLLGGMTILALLWWINLATKDAQLPPEQYLRTLKPWAVLALFILIGQIFLGAWTSTNYAALACPNFPFCHGTLFPHMDWRSAFNLTSPIGPNYEGGRLAMNARVTIQMAHRYGAFLTATYFLIFSLCLISVKRFRAIRYLGWIMLLLLAIQFSLGVLNIELLLPMWTAVAHNGCAALLLLSVVTVLYKLFAKRRGI